MLHHAGVCMHAGSAAQGLCSNQARTSPVRHAALELVVLPIKVLYYSSTVIVVSHTIKQYLKNVLIILSLLVCFIVALFLYYGGFGYLPVYLTGLSLP